jgi:hypothetical protein
MRISGYLSHVKKEVIRAFHSFITEMRQDDSLEVSPRKRIVIEAESLDEFFATYVVTRKQSYGKEKTCSQNTF